MCLPLLPFPPPGSAPAMEFPGLSFSPGLKLQEEIRRKLGVPVSHPSVDRSSFSLVAAFGCYKFRFSPASVGVLLQVAIGGSAAHFNVSQLGERMFKFLVSTKAVGLLVVNLRSFRCDSFKVTFFLWGISGPNWRLEYKLFLKEEANSWATVSSKSFFSQNLR